MFNMISGQLARFSYPFAFADLEDGSLGSLFASQDECRPKWAYLRCTSSPRAEDAVQLLGK